MDYVKVVVELDDKFSGKMQKITNEMHSFIRINKEASSALTRLVRSNEDAAKSFKTLTQSATKSFSNINRGSLSQASSKVQNLTAQLAALTQAANKAVTAVSSIGSGSSSGGASKSKVYQGIENALKKARKKTLSLLSSVYSTGSDTVKYASSKALEFSKSGLSLSSDTEQNMVSFEALLGSEAKAKSFDKELTQFTSKTPFERSQIRNTSQKLLASNYNPDEVIGMLTSFGNVATGKGLGGAGFEELASTFSKMKTDGVIVEKEMSRLTTLGIPAWDILASKMKLSKEELMKMSKENKLPAADSIKELLNYMNQMYPEAMNKQGNTLAGLLATIKNTFNFSLLERWGAGISTALIPRLQTLTAWIDKNGATLDRWGQAIQNIAFTATYGLLNALQGAFNHIQTNYLNNPDFMNLDIKGKVDFIFSELQLGFDVWYANGGDQQIRTTVSSLIEHIGQAAAGSSEHLFSIGFDIMKSLLLGVADGLNKFIKDNPKLSGILAFLLTPGSPQVKAAIAVSTYGGALINNEFDRVYENRERLAQAGNEFSRKLWDEDNSTPLLGETTLSSDNRPWYKKLKDDAFNYAYGMGWVGPPSSSNAGGLDRVPYNGYHALLHKDERVQTKAEADAWRSGDARSPLQFNFHYHGERMSEAEIDNVMGIFVRKMEALS